MEKGDKLTGGPYWTQNWIEAMWRFTAERFVDFDTGTVDFEALGREEYEFRKALFFRNFKNSPRAREAFDAAADDYSKKVANGQKGGRPKKETTAGAPSREDGESKSGSGNAVNLGSATPANIYGDAESGDASEATTTISDFSEARQSKGRAGTDSVRGTPCVPARSRAKNSRCPNSREEFHAFVADNSLHEGLAEEWFAIHEARGWVDENGSPIKNWRGALKNYCIKIGQKRRTA